MDEKKINVLFDIEYIDTISGSIGIEKIEKFNQIKSQLDYLKKLKLITVNEWYTALIFCREKLNLPYCK